MVLMDFTGEHSSAAVCAKYRSQYPPYEALGAGKLFMISLTSERGSFMSFHSLLMIMVALSFAV